MFRKFTDVTTIDVEKHLTSKDNTWLLVFDLTSMTFNPSLTTGVILLTKFLTSTSVVLKLHLNFTEINQDLYSVQVWIWPKFSFCSYHVNMVFGHRPSPCWPQLYEVYNPTWTVLTIMFRSQGITFTHIHHLLNSSHFGSTRNQKQKSRVSSSASMKSHSLQWPCTMIFLSREEGCKESKDLRQVFPSQVYHIR